MTNYATIVCLGLIMMVIGAATDDSFHSGSARSYATPPSTSAILMFLSGFLLLAIGAHAMMKIVLISFDV
jgi:hypothetical protein